MSWIVVFTKPKLEFVARMHIEAQGYDCYLPLSVEPKRPDPRPMFPRCVFVDTSPLGGLWRPLRSTRGVSNVLMTGDAPGRLQDREIDKLMRREEAGVIWIRAVEKAKTYMPGQTLRIQDGPFCGFDGVFERLSGDDRVRLLVEYLGATRPIEVQAQDVA